MCICMKTYIYIYRYIHIFIYIPGSVYNAGVSPVIPARCSLVVGCFAACCVLLLASLLCCQGADGLLCRCVARCAAYIVACCLLACLAVCWRGALPVFCCRLSCVRCCLHCLHIDFVIARLLTCVVLPVVWLGVLPVCWQKQQHGSMRYRGFYF